MELEVKQLKEHHTQLQRRLLDSITAQIHKKQKKKTNSQTDVMTETKINQSTNKIFEMEQKLTALREELSLLTGAKETELMMPV